ncbi:MAG TPA: outer membrane beta-barrel protein [Thermoanaerobaculia bacterium]|nr:outer membrane beta-barrel protein [Thermoanaerobaculia bacterium]
MLAELEKARFHIGPFYLLSELELNPLFDLGYDLNLLMPATSEKRDWGIAVGAPLKAFFVPSKKFVMTADARPVYRWYLHNEENRDLSWAYRGDIHFLFNHLYLNFHAEIADQRLRDRLELNNLVDRETVSWGSAGELTLSSRTNINFSAAYRDIEYPDTSNQPDESITQLSREETSFHGAIRHHTFPTTWLRSGIDVTDYQFDSTARDSQRREVFIGATRDRAIHDLDIQIGYLEQTHDTPDFEDFGGIVGTVQWSYHPRRRLDVRTLVERQLEFSTFGANSHYVLDRVQLITVVPLGQRLKVDLQGQVGRARYPMAEAMEDGTFARRTDDLLFAAIGGIYQITRQFGAGFGVGYFERNSNFEQFSEDGIQLLLRLSLRP